MPRAPQMKPAKPALPPRPGSEPSVSTRLKRHAIAVASAFGGLAVGLQQGAVANPVAPQVVNGQATFNAAGNTLTITNTPGAIINWQSFSIGASEATKFNQQSASSAVLNRVVGADPSAILGQLQSNGKVFLINPNGIVFGQGARIDVGGLAASTAHITNEDFIAGRLKFQAGAIQGNVVNQGTINAASGGTVVLVGKDVSNQGIIRAPNGQIVLAAGKTVEVLDTTTPGVKVVFTADNNKAENLGELVGQNVNIAGALLRNKGIINANQVSRDAQGRIVLSATKGVSLESGSTITANGPQGGSVTITAGSDIKVEGNTLTQANGSVGTGGVISLKSTEGNINVSAGALIQANGASAATGAALAVPNPGQAGGFIAIQSVKGSTTIAGALEARGIKSSLTVSPGNTTTDVTTGGTVQVLGQDVALVGGATVDTSGTDGGGVILVGGDYQGKNADVQNALRTYVDTNVILKADAELKGNGGKVVVWADEATHFVGSLSARGGRTGGNGGFGEVSGKEYLFFRGRANLGADQGDGGQLLLDPGDIILQRITTTTGDESSPGPFTAGYSPTSASAVADIDAIEAVLNGGTSVAIATTNGSGGTGNITLAAGQTILKSNGGANTLTLHADNDIVLQTGSSISATSTTLGVNLEAGNTISIVGTAAINTNGGNLNWSAPGAITLDAGTSVNAGAGNFFITGGSVTGLGAITANNVIVASNNGISLAGSNFISTFNFSNALTGNVVANFIGGSDTNISASDNSAVGGTISLAKSGAGNLVLDGAAVTTKAGAINLTGTGGSINFLTGSSLDTTLGGNAGGAAITLIADDMQLLSTPGAITAGSNSGSHVALRPWNNARPIDLGTNTAGKLGLTNGELGSITTGGELIIGGSGYTGGIMVSSNISVTNAPTIRLSMGSVSGASIDISGTAGITVSSLAANVQGGDVNLTGSNQVTNFALFNAASGDQSRFNNIGDLNISSFGGVSGINAPGATHTVSLTTTGTLTQSALANINTKNLTITAGQGIALDNAGNQITTLTATNSSTGSISVTNTAATLNLGAINQVSSNTVSINNTGSINVTNSINSNGATALHASSNIDFNTAGIAVGATALNLTAGGAVNFANTAGTVTINAPVNTPIGTLTQFANAGTRTLNGVSVSTFAGGVLLTGGTIDGTGALNVSGSLDWQNSVIGGSGALNTYGATTYSNNATLTGKTWNNYGNANNTSGYLIMNTATVENQAGGVMGWNSGGPFRSNSGVNVVNNLAGGIINKTAAGNATLDDFGTLTAFNNAGTVNVSAGTLLLNRGGVDTGTYNISSLAALNSQVSRTFNSGINFNGSGSLVFSGGTQSFGASQTISAAGLTVYLQGGTLSTSNGFTVAGTFDWQNSIFTGGGTLNTSGVTTYSNNATLNGSTWNIHGNTTNAGSYLNMTNASVNVQSGGTVTLTGGSAFRGQSGANSVSNLAGGTIVAAAAGTITFDDFGNLTSFANSGTVNVNSGTLWVNRPFTQSATATINVSSGATFSTSAGFTNNGLISGSGSIDVGGSNTLANAGVIRPGGLNTTGTLRIVGNLAFSSGGTLEIEVGGTPVSGNFDKLNVTGATNLLNGTATFSEIGGHTVSAGESYAFINGTTAPTNAFSVVNGIAGASGNVSIVGNNVQYNVNGLTNEWVGGTDFLWGTAANWSRGHAPTVSEEADFANDGNINVTADTGSMFARSIIASGATALHLTGGSLELNGGATTFATGNSVNFAGGQLQITHGGSFTLGTGATMTVSGSGSSIQIGPSGGSFTGQGTINVNENFSVTRSGATGVFDLAAGTLNIATAKTLSIGSGANLFGWNGGTINNVGTGTLTVGDNFDVTGTRSAGVLNVSAGSIAFSGGGMITANTVTLNSASGISNTSGVLHVIDTSAGNGAINLTGQTAAIGSQANPITVNAGTGLVSATTLATFGAGDINLASNNTIRVGSIVNDSVARVGNENAQVQEVRINASGASSDIVLTQGLATYDNFTLVAGRHVDFASTGTLEIGQSLNLTAGGNVLSTGAAALDINANVSAFSSGRPSTTVANITGTSIGTAGNYLSYDGYNNQPTLRTTGVGAAGDAYVGVPQSSFIGLPNVTTDAGSAQTINFSGAGVVTLTNRNYGNDNLAIISSDRLELGHTISAATINITGTAANYVFRTIGAGVLDTSATNGAITLVSQRADGNYGIGDSSNPVRVNSGTGAVSANVGYANIYLTQASGDLSTSQYTLSGVSGERTMHLQADAGHVNINSNINMTGAQMSFATPAAGKDVIFAGGQLTGHALTINANRNIVNSAPGTVGFTQDGTGGNVFMTLVAGGGIGTVGNPIETAHWWVTGLTTSGVGSAGDIYVKNATTGGSGGLRLGRLITDGGSAQTIELKQTGVASDAFVFVTNQPGYGGTVNLGADNLIVDTTLAGSDIALGISGATGQNITLRSGKDILDSSGGNTFFSGVTGSANLSAVGTIGTLTNPIRIEGGAALNVVTTGAAGDIYLRTDSTALNVGSITTAAGSAQTVNLRSNLASTDLVFANTSSTNDNWTVQSARDVIFSGTGSIGGANVNLTAAGAIASGAAISDIIATGTVNLSAAAGIDLDLNAAGVVVNHTNSNAINLRGDSAGMTLAANTFNGSISVSNTGNLTATGAVNAGADAVFLTSSTGSVTQTAGGAITAMSLNVSAATGINLTAASNSVNDFAASNSTSGGINFNNTAGTLVLGGITQAGGGSVGINNTGNIATGASIVSNGDTTLTAVGATADIKYTDDFTGTATGAQNFTLQAGRDIWLGNKFAPTTITKSNSTALNIDLNSDFDGNNLGGVVFWSTASNTLTIDTKGGDVRAHGGAGFTGFAVGSGNAPTLLPIGVEVQEGTTINTSGGSVYLYGKGGAGITSGDAAGIIVDGHIHTETGSINITGEGGSGSGGLLATNGVGIGGELETSTGAITLVGTGGTGSTAGSFRVGVGVGNGANIETAAGTVNISGVGGSGGGAGGLAVGIAIIEDATLVATTGDGTFTLNGTGGAIGGGAGGHGVMLGIGGGTPSGGHIESAGGFVNIAGQGALGMGLNGAHGVLIHQGSSINLTGDGMITIFGSTPDVGAVSGSRGIAFNNTAGLHSHLGGAGQTQDINLTSANNVVPLNGPGMGLGNVEITTSNVLTINTVGGSPADRPTGQAAGSTTEGIITTNGLFVLSSGAGDINLTSTANTIGNMSGSVTGNLAVTNSTGLDISNNLSVGGNLSLVANGAITQTGGLINVTGTALFDTSQDTSIGSVDISANTSLTLAGGSKIAGNLTATAATLDFGSTVDVGGDASVVGSLSNINNLRVVGTNGAISNANTITASGASPNDFILTSGMFTTSASNVTINLFSSGYAKSLVNTTGQAVTLLGSNSFGGPVTLNTVNPNLTAVGAQSYNLNQTGLINFSGNNVTIVAGPGNGDVFLTNAGNNNLGGISFVNTRNTNLRMDGASSAALGPVSLATGGSLNVTAGDNISINGAISAAGKTVTLVSTNVDVTQTNLTGGQGIVAGLLNVSANSGISILNQTNAVGQVNLTNSTSGNVDFVTATPGNLSISGLSQIASGSASIANVAGGIMLDQAINHSGAGALTFDAAGSVNQAAGAPILGANIAVLTRGASGANSINLVNSGNTAQSIQLGTFDATASTPVDGTIAFRNGVSMNITGGSGGIVTGSGGSITLIQDAGTVTQQATAHLEGGSLTLMNGGTFALNNAPNAVGVLSANAGSIDYQSAIPFAVNALTMNGNVTLSSGNGSPINLTGASVTGTGDLTVNTAGKTSFGSINITGQVSTDAGGTAEMHGPINADFVFINDPTLLFANVTTSQAQTFNGPVTLANSVTLTNTNPTGTGIYLYAPVDGASAGAQNLTINSASDVISPLAAPIGSTTALGSVNISAASTIASNGISANGGISLTAGSSMDIAGNYTTTNAPAAFNGLVSVNSPTAIATGTGSVNFSNAVDGSGSLNVTGGPVSFVSSVGGGGPLNGVNVTATGIVTVGSTITSSGGINLTGTGIALNGSALSAAGTVGISGPTTLGTAVTVTGTNTTIDGSVTGAHAFTVPGAVSLNGNVTTTGANQNYGAVTLTGNTILSGSSVNFASLNMGASINDLTLTSGGALNLTGLTGTANNLTVTGPVTIGSNLSASTSLTLGDITLSAPVTLSAGAGALTVGAVSGSQALTLTAGTTATINGALGSGTPLSSLNITAPGGVTATNGNINVAGPITISDPLYGSVLNVTGTSITISPAASVAANISGTGPLTLAGANNPGSLNVTSTGAISQMAPPVVVGGVSNFSAGGAVLLNNTANNFSVVNASAAGGSVSLADVDGIVLGNIGSPGGPLSVVAGGSVSQSAPLTVASINLTGNGITLNNSGNSFTDAVLRGGTGTINVTTSAALNLSGLTTSTGTAINANGINNLGTINTGSGPIALNAGSGTLTTGTLMGGTTTLFADTVVAGSVAVSDLAVQATTAPTFTLTGNLTATNSMLLDDMTITGATTLVSGPGGMQLFNVAGGANTLNLQSGGAIGLNGPITAGSLNASAIGAIGQAGAINASLINVTANGILLNDAGNTFSTAILTAPAGNVAVNSTSNLNFSLAGTPGAVTVSSSGTINQTGASLSASGQVVMVGQGVSNFGNILGSGVQISSGTGALNTGSINASTGALYLVGDSIGFGGALSGSTVTLAPYTGGTPVALGSGSGFVVPTGAFSSITGSLTISTSGPISVNSGVSYGNNLKLFSSSAINVNAGLSSGGVLNLDPATIAITGATVQGSSVSLAASNSISLTGSASGPAAVVATSGSISMSAPNVSFTSGGGNGAFINAVVGPATLTSDACTGCATLATSPTVTSVGPYAAGGVTFLSFSGLPTTLVDTSSLLNQSTASTNIATGGSSSTSGGSGTPTVDTSQTGGNGGTNTGGTLGDGSGGGGSGSSDSFSSAVAGSSGGGSTGGSGGTSEQEGSGSTPGGTNTQQPQNKPQGKPQPKQVQSCTAAG